MRNIITGITLAAFLVALPAFMARGQSNGTAQMSTAKVAQGKQVSMDVTVDKAANVGARIYVDVSPEGSQNQFQLWCQLPAGQVKCSAANTLPVDAKLGKWVISAITFAPDQGGGQTLLSKHGNLSFEVVAGEKIVSPDSATVSDIK